MAPALLAFAFSSVSSKESNGNTLPFLSQRNGTDLSIAVDQSDVEVLRFRNLELQKKFKESQRREEEARAELEELQKRLARVEEAEELLCSQLGDLEAEAVQQASAYNRHINMLKERLTHTENLLADARAGLERCR